MRSNEKYSYSKYRSNETVPAGSGKVFVGPKIEYTRNPVINFPAKFWGNIGIILLVLLAIWFIFFSRFFQIKEIIVEGNSQVTTEEIVKNVSLNQNIFRFNISNIRNKIISMNPIIEDVAIYRGIPNALKIVVLEKKPQVVWQSGGNYFLIDDGGIVDRKIDASEYTDLIHIVDQKNMPMNIGDQLLSSGFINFVENVKTDFFDKTNTHITSYYVTETTFDLYIQTDGGFFVKFDTTRAVDKQLNDLKDILVAYRPNIHEYVDVRINGWAYYK